MSDKKEDLSVCGVPVWRITKKMEKIAVQMFIEDHINKTSTIIRSFSKKLAESDIANAIKSASEHGYTPVYVHIYPDENNMITVYANEK